MSIQVTDFKWEKGKNDVQYIELLEKTLKNEQVITANAVAKIRELTEKNKEMYSKGYNQGTIDRAEEIQKAREYGYAKAVEEFADAIKSTLPIAVHIDCSELDYEIDYALYNMRLKVDKIAEEMKGGAK